MLLFLVLSGIEQIYSQVFEQWVARYNGNGNYADGAYSIDVDDFGYVYVTGSSWGNGTNNDFVTIKYDPTGTPLWVKTYNGSGNHDDQAIGLALDNENNVYVTGSSKNGDLNYDILTIKYDSAGVVKWIQSYNGTGNVDDAASAIVVDDFGNVFVTGMGHTGQQIIIVTIKYSPTGAKLWEVNYSGGEVNEPRTIALDGLGNIYVAGTSFNGTNYDFLIIKYNSLGTQQWVKLYGGSGEGSEAALSLGFDVDGNVYTTGALSIPGLTTDIAVLKYNLAGVLQWAKTYNGLANANDLSKSLKVDESGNIYVVGASTGIGTSLDLVVIKYNSAGVQQWVERYDGPASGADVGTSLELDELGNIYITGYGAALNNQADFTTLKYKPDGELQWIQIYSGPGNLTDFSYDIALDSLGGVYITGASYGIGSGSDYATIKYSQAAVLNPRPFDKWIAAETDTIKWIENGWASVNIKCVTNFETPIESEIILTQGFPIVSPEFGWEIPDTLLSYKSKIIVENANNPNEKIESDIFRIKPYVLTRVKEDSTYYEYRKNRDQWGFSNIPEDMWPPTWWAQFNYQGIDPFTGSQYSQWQNNFVFAHTLNREHPDWISFVNTFTVDACYISTTLGIYSSTAITRWETNLGLWGGSCFGIAATNALAFAHKEQFINKYPDFPSFINPISVTSDNAVKKTVNELFSHQYGNPHKIYRSNIGLSKTPKETLIELVDMFKEDEAQIRTLSFNHNNGSGGHAILAYGLEKDEVNPSLFHIKVYDNSNPNSNIRITIDTSANGNNGSWVNPDWPGWGGNIWFYLRDATVEYLVNPTLTDGIAQQSPFILDGSELEVFKTITASIKIQDNIGNTTGFYNNLIQTNIPGSNPFIVDNGSETPPYGYTLTTENYSVVLNEFENDTVDVFFFTGNKSFSYERYGATASQTDRLFFDGGISAVNPDLGTKTITLLNIINETSQEKLFVVRSVELAQNDSVKIENPDSNKVKLISYGTAKDYDIELNYATENGLGRFGDCNITLPENTSHIFVPDWLGLTASQLVVLVDFGNDGTIDDTLFLNNTVGVEDEGILLTPNEFNLARNYPNPFNPVTTIQYSISERSNVTLKVYDILGNEVAVLVNDEKERGVYSVNFDATQLASGIYFYRIQAGSLVETKKMLMIK